MGLYLDFDFFIVTFKKVLRDMNNMMGASVEMARMAKMDFCWWAQERERPREEAKKGGTFISSTAVSNICH